MVGGDKVPGRRIDNVIEFANRVEAVVDGLEKFDRVHDFPPGK